MNEAIELVRKALATFDGDPAESDYQRGYQAALEDLLADLVKAEPA